MFEEFRIPDTSCFIIHGLIQRKVTITEHKPCVFNSPQNENKSTVLCLLLTHTYINLKRAKKFTFPTTGYLSIMIISIQSRH